jgi:hypothetical protein
MWRPTIKNLFSSSETTERRKDQDVYIGLAALFHQLVEDFNLKITSVTIQVKIFPTKVERNLI